MREFLKTVLLTVTVLSLWFSIMLLTVGCLVNAVAHPFISLIIYCFGLGFILHLFKALEGVARR
jgi:hypothetical protein